MNLAISTNQSISVLPATKTVSLVRHLEQKDANLAQTWLLLSLLKTEVSPVFTVTPSQEWLSLRVECVSNSVEMEGDLHQLSAMMVTRLVMMGAVLIVKSRMALHAKEAPSLLLIFVILFRFSSLNQPHSLQVGLLN